VLLQAFTLIPRTALLTPRGECQLARASGRRREVDRWDHDGRRDHERDAVDRERRV